MEAVVRKLEVEGVPPIYNRRLAYRDGIIYVTDRSVYVHCLFKTSVEKTALPQLVMEEERFKSVFTSECGDVLVFTYGPAFVVWRRSSGEARRVETDYVTEHVYVEQGKIVILAGGDVVVEDVEMVLRGVRGMEYLRIERSVEMEVQKLAHKSESSVLYLVGEGVVFCAEADLPLHSPPPERRTGRLREEKAGKKDAFSLFALEEALHGLEGAKLKSRKVRARAKRMTPEPIAFIKERVRRTIVTAWGLCMVYETGVEVYAEEEEYVLRYVLKRRVEEVERYDGLAPREDVVVRDGASLLLLGRTEPAKIREMEGDAIVVGGVVVVRSEGSIFAVKMLRREEDPVVFRGRGTGKGGEQKEGEGGRKEGGGLRGEEEAFVEEMRMAIERYRKLDVREIRIQSKEEYLLFVKKIVNRIERDLTDKMEMAVALLEEKMESVEEGKRDIERMEVRVRALLERIAVKSRAIIGRIEGVVSEHGEMLRRAEGRRKRRDVEEAEREVEEMRGLVEEGGGREYRGVLAVLREQNRTLKRRVSSLGG